MKTILFNPFEKYAEKILFFIGVIITIFVCYVSAVLDVRFDGAFDVHVVSATYFSQALLDNVINIFSLFVFLFISGKYLNKKTRVIDILNVVLIARLPLYLSSLFNINSLLGKTSQGVLDMVNTGEASGFSSLNLLILVLFLLVIILLLTWSVVLLYNGFKVASNAKSRTGTILFIISLLLAEVLSKILIFQFN